MCVFLKECYDEIYLKIDKSKNCVRRQFISHWHCFNNALKQWQHQVSRGCKNVLFFFMVLIPDKTAVNLWRVPQGYEAVTRLYSELFSVSTGEFSKYCISAPHSHLADKDLVLRKRAWEKE